jgi:hypothetical protein
MAVVEDVLRFLAMVEGDSMTLGTLQIAAALSNADFD